MEETGGSLSAVTRMALQLGLERFEELDIAFRRAAYREGVVAGLSEYKKSLAGIDADLNQVKRTALNGVDAALAGWQK